MREDWGGVYSGREKKLPENKSVPVFPKVILVPCVCRPLPGGPGPLAVLALQCIEQREQGELRTDDEVAGVGADLRAVEGGLPSRRSG